MPSNGIVTVVRVVSVGFDLDASGEGLEGREVVIGGGCFDSETP